MSEAYSVDAYRQTIRETEEPRKAERRVFSTVTGQLDRYKAAFEGRDLEAQGHLREALAKNRTLWSLLLSDATHSDNTLPNDLKAQIISIAMFVDRHTVNVLKGEGDVTVLIDVNRSVMDGLKAAQPSEG